MGANPGLFAAAAGGGRRLDGARPRRSSTSRCHPGEFVTDHLATGDFQVAVVDVHRRPRPGPLSAARLEPDPDRWIEHRRAPGSGPSTTSCCKARAPGTTEERKAAYSALQKQLAAGRYLLPLTFSDEVVVARDTVEGPIIRQVTDPSDRFWDVLTWRLADGR